MFRLQAQASLRAWADEEATGQTDEIASVRDDFEEDGSIDNEVDEEDALTDSVAEEGSEVSDEDDAQTPTTEPDFQDISFGALAKAQESLAAHQSQPRKRKQPSSSHSETLSNFRTKLRKTMDPSKQSQKQEQQSLHRSSKHAPQLLSSARPVTRKRSIFSPPPSLKSRDPRFDPTITPSSATSTSHSNKNYAFLSTYRDAEITSLRSQIKALKTSKKAPPPNTPSLGTLQRDLDSLVSHQARAKQTTLSREIMQRHKKAEKEAIASGRKEKPYFLKRSELKREVEKEITEGMGKRKREKRERRRRKRVEGKQKKQIPRTRREVQK